MRSRPRVRSRSPDSALERRKGSGRNEREKESRRRGSSREDSGDRALERRKGSVRREMEKESGRHGSSREESEARRSRGKRAGTPEQTSKAKKARKQKHDWGIASKAPAVQEEQTEARKAPSVPISEVPDDLRARIKAMLAMK
jgi:hypothetical protein